MEFLYFLEKLRMPGLNEFMLLITQLGEETAFLVVALILFWCVDKYKGYYILSVGFIGTLANQFMKLWFRIPRPWVLDENFTILEQAREAASGYSFPSGHTQSSIGTFGGIAMTAKNRWVRIAAIVIAVLVPFSRMYIGVHTPLDVLVAVAMAVVLLLVLKPLVLGNREKTMPWLLGVMTVMAVAFLCFVSFWNFPADIDEHNLQSGFKNAYTLLGALLGLLVVYIVDEKWLNFQTEAVWWAQILKVAGGLAAVLVVKSGLKTPLNALFGEYPGRAVRYGLIVLVAGILWPLTFRWFSGLGKKKE
ncbi:MAG: phosphatase PAP2 family protein [Oscillospiraceae bacterium]|nr:phosphatase PAP2 family protein [Oscillospiraceae bacterium]